MSALKPSSFALNIAPHELRLEVSLCCGMSFRWQPLSEHEWQGVLGDAELRLEQTSDYVICHIESGKIDASVLHDYFQLETPLAPLVAHWAKADARLAEVAPAFRGLRVLRMEPFECLISFICSSANNITRITGMVNRLCQQLGKELPGGGFSFPSVSRVAECQSQQLRSLGFGYRAEFVVNAARFVQAQGEGWLEGLRSVSYEEAHTALQQLPGVGTKVADCVCLFALDKPGAIPVDTHVWQIARRDYGLFPDAKSITPKIYVGIGDFFRERFGDHAGWAHNLLFAADLPIYRDRLSC
ncbi:MAG: DNA glycosylase [Armatimonadota bacterium]